VSGADPDACRRQRDDRIRCDCPDDPRRSTGSGSGAGIAAAACLSASAHLAGGERLSHLYLCGLPERWAADAPEQLRESCISYRKSLYLWLEEQLAAAPYALGRK
jgi:hypothetical protein